MPWPAVTTSERVRELAGVGRHHGTSSPSGTIALVSTPSSVRTPRSASARVSAPVTAGEVDDAAVDVEVGHVGVEVREPPPQRLAVEGLGLQAQARQRLEAQLRVGAARGPA